MTQKRWMVLGGVVIAGLVVALLWALNRGTTSPSAPVTPSPSAPVTPSPSAPVTPSPSAPETPSPSAPGPLDPFSPEARSAATEERLMKVKAGLDAWLKKHMSYPELAELLVRDDYLLPRDFDDAWGRRIDYQRLDELHYRLCSRGPDNLPKTDDDVCVGGRP